jgi:hypothetical protein
MMKREIVALAFLVGVAGGCADDIGSVDGFVEYEVYGGLGGWSGEARIAPDGTMTRRMLDGTTDTTVLPPAALDNLRHNIDVARFPTLDSQYGCGGCADDFVHTITVEIRRRRYTVKADGHDSPERLRPVVDQLYGLVGFVTFAE